MLPSPDPASPDATFAEHRAALLAVARRVVGRHADAEDVVQDAWLRWRAVDHRTVLDARAYLVRATTRLALDRLRRGPGRHETASGARLPESALAVADAAAAVERADDVLEAMAVLLATLSPLERTVFVLREAFSMSHAELAVALGRSEPAVRQLASRARRRVDQRTARYAVDRRARASAADHFLAACAGGGLDRLLATLAPGTGADRGERIAC